MANSPINCVVPREVYDSLAADSQQFSIPRSRIVSMAVQQFVAMGGYTHYAKSLVAKAPATTTAAPGNK